MDYPTFILLFSSILTFIYALTTTSRRRHSRLPPGPYPLPIIGNLLKLSDKPHQSLAILSKKYGPLMTLKLESRTTIVVSSPEIAKEFFHTHDASFSSRSIPCTGRVMDHDKYSIVWLPTGDRWRRLRRITREYLFSVQCLDGSELLRREKALFIVGTDTTSTTLEWAMAELIRNPKKMETARSEVMKLMQNNNGNIQESHISQLPYLQAVVKETLRLHPPAPFLVPHQAIDNVEVQGFIVPKNAQIPCNVWAMGRDPNIWSDPEMFIPQRFLDVKIDYKGQDYEFIPFGAGRRIWPGLNIAHKLLHVILGSLIYKFNWKPEGSIRAEDIDMEEKFGLTVPRKVPLMAIPIKR